MNLFHGPVFLPNVTMTFISWPSVFALYQIDLSTSWNDIILDLKKNIGHNDLYFMAQCFCLISDLCMT